MGDYPEATEYATLHIDRKTTWPYLATDNSNIGAETAIGLASPGHCSNCSILSSPSIGRTSWEQPRGGRYPSEFI